jgi:hypothetical protein
MARWPSRLASKLREDRLKACRARFAMRISMKSAVIAKVFGIGASSSIPAVCAAVIEK